MMYLKYFCDHVGNRAIADQVEIVEKDMFRRTGSFQSVFSHGRDRAAGTVFKDDHRLLIALFSDLL